MNVRKARTRAIADLAGPDAASPDGADGADRPTVAGFRNRDEAYVRYMESWPEDEDADEVIRPVYTAF